MLTNGRINRKALVLAFVFALAVRAAYDLACYLVAGDAALMVTDSSSYVSRAEELVALAATGALSGWDYLGPDLIRMPIPAWLMATTYAAFGEGHILAYTLIQGVIDAITCVIVGMIAERLRHGLFAPAAIIAALNPTMVVVAGLYLTDTIFLLFCCLFFHAVLSWTQAPSWRRMLLIGLYLGLATMCRSFTFVFIPAMAVALVVAGLVIRIPPMRAVAQAIIFAAVAVACVSPILVRNYVRHDAIAMTPQSGVHMLLWQVSLVREIADGTPFSQSAPELQSRFDSTHPDLNRSDPFAVSDAMTAMALEELGKYGAGTIAQAWAIGAAINLGAPAATIVPVVAALPRTGFYDTPGETKLDKVYAFLFESESPHYAWIIGLGIIGVVAMRCVQLRGLAVWSRSPIHGGRLYLGFAILWIAFVLVINGPIASPKYRLPIEPFLVIALAFGINRPGREALQRPT